MYMVRHRTYDPVLGRWIERDPLGVPPMQPAEESASYLHNVYGVDSRGFQRNASLATTSVYIDKPDHKKQYHDGMCLYEFVQSRPSSGLDPSGTTCRRGDISYSVVPYFCTTRGQSGVEWCTRQYRCKINPDKRVMTWVLESTSCLPCEVLGTPQPAAPPTQNSSPNRPLDVCEQWARCGGATLCQECCILEFGNTPGVPGSKHSKGAAPSALNACLGACALAP